MQKGFAPIIIIVGILVLALVAGAFYYTKLNPPNSTTQQIATNSATPADSTTNWKTYINNPQGFSIQYPVDYQIEEYPVQILNSKYPQDLQYVLIHSSDKTHPFTIAITPSTVTPGITLSNVVSQLGGCAQNGANQGKTTKGYAMMIGGKEAVIFEDTLCGLSGATNIYTFNGTKAYTIDIGFTSGRTTYQDIESKVSKILSTFKFTN